MNPPETTVIIGEGHAECPDCNSAVWAGCFSDGELWCRCGRRLVAMNLNRELLEAAR